MGDPTAYQQLLEMGIPGGRARAALLRAKDDVMAAAERVFAGEFDDIPSDDEGGAAAASEAGPSRPRVSAGAHASDQSITRRIADDVVITDDLPDDDSMEDGLDQKQEVYDDDDDEVFDGFEDDADEDDTEEHRFSDPYAGIFFSKDRVEDVIENMSEPEYVNIKIPSYDTSESLGKKTLARTLSSGEWMSGCPEGNEQSFLFQLYNKLFTEPVDCAHTCGHRFERKKQDFFAVPESFPDYLKYLNSIIRPECPKCAHITCLACGQRCERVAQDLELSICEEDDAESRVALANDALLHCVDLQGVIIGVGLYVIESTFSAKTGPVDTPPKTPPSKRRRKDARLGNKAHTLTEAEIDQDEDNDEEVEDYASGLGIYGGRASSAAAGTGYAGNVKEDRSGQIKAQANQKLFDAKFALLLGQVRVYLPQLNRRDGPRTSDHLVHPTALAHLRRRSGFVNALLRNDSLLDMSNRGDLYRALFDWLEVISSHEATASMLAMPQMRPVRISPIPNQQGVVTVTYEGSASPRELLESVVIQAKAALKGLESTSAKRDKAEDKEMTEEEMRQSKDEAKAAAEKKKVELAADENQQLHEFCNRILSSAQTIDRSLVETKGREFVERMRASLPKLPGEDNEGVAEIGRIVSPSGATGEAVIRIYEEWVTKARFQYSDLSYTSEGKQAYHHAFSSGITAIEGQNVPKRSLAIAKELAVLTTNLPVAWNSSIFLRVDESRVDCIKALITGPEGTPYQDGCFIFDIFLPLEYNQKCPTVKSMTTNGGRYRYNPNLYADGKVCLSLLGTWSGPGWIAGQSTLLQVLISIQSLILCEEPYCNEPGWAADGGSPKSQAYSANVRRMVMVDAMAGNIKNPPFPSAGNANGDTATVGQTKKKKEDTAFLKAAKELRELLDGLEKGDGFKEAAAADTADPADQGRRVTRSSKLSKMLGLNK